MFSALCTQTKSTPFFLKNYSITYVRMENFVCQYKNKMQTQLFFRIPITTEFLSMCTFSSAYRPLVEFKTGNTNPVLV